MSQLMSPTHAKRPRPICCAFVSVLSSCALLIMRGKLGAQPAPCSNSERYGAIWGV